MGIELIDADLSMARAMFGILELAAGIKGVGEVEIRFKGEDDADTIVIGYGKAAEPCITDVIPFERPTSVVPVGWGPSNG